MFEPVTRALKSDKKDILRFYKSQQYSARFIGGDNCYFIKNSSRIIACLMLSTGQSSNNSTLLHALVVDKKSRGMGIASLLLRDALIAINMTNTVQKVVCFSSPSLERLYLNNNFMPLALEKINDELSVEFQQRFHAYSVNQPKLRCFQYSYSNINR